MKTYQLILIFSVFIFVAENCLAEDLNLLISSSDSTINTFNKDFVYHAKKAKGKIIVDGVFGEPDWLIAEKASNFYKVLPIDSGIAESKSEVMITYDDKAFFMAVTFFDDLPGKRLMESFRRDFIFGNNDNFLVFFDTFLDQTNGFSFGVSASGAKWDGIMHDGQGSNLIWDCKWDSKIVHSPDKWTIEMRIPFRSIRFKSGSDMWFVNFSRMDLKRNEKSAWAPMPRQFPTSSLAYAGVLKWEEPLPKSKTMFSVIPYVFSSVTKDFEKGTAAKYQKDFGFDAKIGISNAMNLDLTYNPDFSQSEVDAQVTNLDRYELFFPEKRQFFLENSDLFSGFGYSTVTPFFSRRIGLDAPVLGGVRLSGKIDKNWRLGLMNMQTEKTDDLLARNFTVASLQRKVFARSNVGMIFVNKEVLNKPKGTQDFNRVVGLDYNLASKNNTWTGKIFYHRSFDEINPGKQYAQGAHLEYNTRRLGIEFAQTSVGENYNAETGYIRRTAYNFLGPEVNFRWVPNKWITEHGIHFSSDNFYDTDYKKLDHENTIAYNFIFKNRSEFSIGTDSYYVRLERDFDPTNKSGIRLQKGSEYNYRGFWAEYTSDNRNFFKYNVVISKGSYYNGNYNFTEGSLSYRFQPYLNFNMAFTYTDIILPAPFIRTKMWLLSPKLDLTFSDKLFLSSFVQYNEQIDNMNVNIRLQWRYKPVSDLFIVFSDNYFTENWTSRNRAIILKLSYWFN